MIYEIDQKSSEFDDTHHQLSFESFELRKYEGCSTIGDELPHHPKVKGLNLFPAVDTGREKCRKVES
jgi:hypothetical protein